MINHKSFTYKETGDDMKLIIASDIHGNLEYTEKLYEYCERIDPEKIILLGDLLNNYFYSDTYEINEIAKIMNRWAAITIAVKGNTDRVDDIDRLYFPIHAPYTEIEIDGIPFYLTHGHIDNPKFEHNYCLVGHTHRYNLDGNQINPGSVGLPRGHKEHTCLLYDNHEFKLINLDDFTVISTKKIEK